MARDLQPGFMPVGPLEHAEQGAPNEMIVSDEQHPRSVFNLVPALVQQRIKEVDAELLGIGEPELRAIFDAKKFKPTVRDDRIRFMFWKEYDGAQTNVRKMNMTHVYFGICSREAFYLMLQNKYATAWLLCPPVDYMLGAEEALTFGLEQLRDVLTRPHTSIMGAVDARAAAVKLEIVKMLDQRVKGAIVQTMKNLNVNVNANKPLAESPNIEDVDKKIKEIECELKELNDGRKTITLMDIEVNATEVTSEPGDPTQD